MNGCSRASRTPGNQGILSLMASRRGPRLNVQIPQPEAFFLVLTQQIQAAFDNSIETNEAPIGGGQ